MKPSGSGVQTLQMHSQGVTPFGVFSLQATSQAALKPAGCLRRWTWLQRKRSAVAPCSAAPAADPGLDHSVRRI